MDNAPPPIVTFGYGRTNDLWPFTLIDGARSFAAVADAGVVRLGRPDAGGPHYLTILFLLGQAIENALKSYLLIRGVTEGELVKIGHDLPRVLGQTEIGTWFDEPLTTITIERLESWKTRRLNAGRKAVTVLRDLFTLSSVLSRATKFGLLPENPIRRVDKPRFDRRPNVRFLDDGEEFRLREALKARDAKMRMARESANIWRRVRSREVFPPLPHFGDHVTPAALLSINTGLRRGELLRLRWKSIDFAHRLLTVEGPDSKTRQTRHVPLNDEAMRVLESWREQSGDGPRVFEISTGFKTAWGHILKRANIVGFRWHDLRHHFASRLVQHGVPLNTVRDLLGHSSIAMSLRYAHLAPDQRREAVAMLNQKPILALTVRLPSNAEVERRFVTF